MYRYFLREYKQRRKEALKEKWNKLDRFQKWGIKIFGIELVVLIMFVVIFYIINYSVLIGRISVESIVVRVSNIGYFALFGIILISILFITVVQIFREKKDGKGNLSHAKEYKGARIELVKKLLIEFNFYNATSVDYLTEAITPQSKIRISFVTGLGIIVPVIIMLMQPFWNKWINFNINESSEEIVFKEIVALATLILIIIGLSMIVIGVIIFFNNIRKAKQMDLLEDLKYLKTQIDNEKQRENIKKYNIDVEPKRMRRCAKWQ